MIEKNIFHLDQKVVLVTGGLGHLGRRIGIALGRRGAHVVLTDCFPPTTAQDALSDLVNQSISCEYIYSDLSLPESRNQLISNFLEEHRSLDILVNNASMVGTSGAEGFNTAFSLQSDEAFLNCLMINLLAPFALARSLSPLLLQSGKGSIINISSIYGLVGPVPKIYDGLEMHQPAAYSASKGGLIQLTRYLATTLAPKIRVNAIAPGGIFREQDPIFVERYSERVPLGRMAKEGDLDGAIVWLASEASAYVTGQVIAVDGGWTSW